MPYALEILRSRLPIHKMLQRLKSNKVHNSILDVLVNIDTAVKLLATCWHLLARIAQSTILQTVTLTF